MVSKLIDIAFEWEVNSMLISHILDQYIHVQYRYEHEE